MNVAWQISLLICVSYLCSHFKRWTWSTRLRSMLVSRHRPLKKYLLPLKICSIQKCTLIARVVSTLYLLPICVSVCLCIPVPASCSFISVASFALLLYMVTNAKNEIILYKAHFCYWKHFEWIHDDSSQCSMDCTCGLVDGGYLLLYSIQLLCKLLVCSKHQLLL